jgi:hypothetical protein
MVVNTLDQTTVELSRNWQPKKSQVWCARCSCSGTTRASCSGVIGHPATSARGV